MKTGKAKLGLALFSIAFATLAVGCELGEVSDLDKKIQNVAERSGTLELRFNNTQVARSVGVEGLEGLESVYVSISEIAVHHCEDKDEEDEDRDDDDRDDDRDDDDRDDDGDDDRDDDGADDDDQAEGGKEVDNGSKAGDKGAEQGSAEGKSIVARDATKDKKSADKKDDKKGEKQPPKHKSKDDKKKPNRDDACENGAWKRIKMAGSAKLDLLALANGEGSGIGVTELPAGHYGQIRFKIESAGLVFNGKEVELEVPSGAKAGLKIKGGFEVVADEQLSLTIGFDAAKSLKAVKGKGWLLKPVIRLLK